jgi:hypothetical protein
MSLGAKGLISYLSKRKFVYYVILFLTMKSTVKEKLRRRVITYSEMRFIFVFHFFCLQATKKNRVSTK